VALVEAPPVAALSATANRVLAARYLRRNASGGIRETADELFARVARAVSQAELALGTAQAADAWQQRFHRLLASLDFLPNSPTLMNAGTQLGQLAACFVLPVDDSMEAIFGALRDMALVQRTGGGTGFAFSRLRPRGEIVASTGGTASGPVSFMRIFDAATENIKQGGRRRGANMGVLRVDHPDVLEFVDAKRSGTDLRNFNLSVAVTDAFMEAVQRAGTYVLVHPVDGRVTAELAAREVFDRIVAAAWESGDPGLVFLDRINHDNPTPALGVFESTNPCGEVPLLPYESCVLGAVNLAHMVGGAGTVDWERLGETVRLAIRFLDDVVEVTREPLVKVAAISRGNRKVGVGVMGFAECLIRLGVSYDSDAAVAWADRIAAFIAAEARTASRRLAEERGVFTNWRRSVYAATGERVRNATRLSIAPTGTISMIAGTSGGIEPLFALAYRRAHALGGAPIVEVNPLIVRHLRADLGDDADSVLAHVLATGTLPAHPRLEPQLRRRFVTATEIPARRHLQVQQAFQHHVDNAVSKTINLLADATPQDVADVYLDAWRLGVKGVTIYRYGSRDEQVLTLGADEEALGRELFTRCDPGACRV
jgi:ribonucleoside-diphosphate reductase alpha chain